MRPNQDTNANALVRRQSDGNRGQLPSLFDPFASMASFANASPFQLMRRMQEDMDHLFAQAFGGSLSASPDVTWGTAARSPFLAPSMDISETDKEYCLEVDLPGVPEDAIDIQVTPDNMLVIRAEVRQESGNGESSDGSSGGGQQAQDQKGQQQTQQQQRQYHYRERRYGRFERALSLPQNVDPQNVRADFRNGVLTVTLPKVEQVTSQGRRIPIGGTSASSEPQQQIGGNIATASNPAPAKGNASNEKSAEAVGVGSGS